LDHLLQRARKTRVLESRGRVVQLTGLVIESEGPMAAVGEVCRIDSPRHDASTMAEVVGFRNHHLLLMPLGEVHGIYPGSEVSALGNPLQVSVGNAMKGRVIDSLGKPMDGKGPLLAHAKVDLNHQPPHPLRRRRISQTFQTGIRAMDTFTPCGRGQRLGIFAGSGVGKSTLLGMIANQAEADVNVIALIGERGREVREFLEKDLSEEGRQKSVVVVATSNEPALTRRKGAFLAMAIAEHFRDEGKNVLLLMDSITRFATAQREIGLAIGEPPATRGYTPSVFSLLPQLLERAGNNEHGSITGLFTVLVEADDMDDPVADSVRSILDGHVILTRELAMQNHYPAIDVLGSVSRLDRDLLSADQMALVGQAREAMAVYRKNQDLINIGAYASGSNPAIEEAIRLQNHLNRFLRQPVGRGVPTPESWQSLEECLAAPAAPEQNRALAASKSSVSSPT
jgi:flagellum-specific ATP synthase